MVPFELGSTPHYSDATSAYDVSPVILLDVLSLRPDELPLVQKSPPSLRKSF
jgi:hypothetical protein